MSESMQMSLGYSGKLWPTPHPSDEQAHQMDTHTHNSSSTMNQNQNECVKSDNDDGGYESDDDVPTYNPSSTMG